MLSAWHQDRMRATPRERIYASAIGGGFSRLAMAVLTRGRSNIIPGGIMFSLFGAGGQTLYNVLDSSHTAKVEAGPVEKRTLTQWVAAQRWSPFSILTDAQYEDILRDKILKLDVEIAIVDDKIAALKEMQLNDARFATGQSDLEKD